MKRKKEFNTQSTKKVELLILYQITYSTLFFYGTYGEIGRNGGQDVIWDKTNTENCFSISESKEIELNFNT